MIHGGERRDTEYLYNNGDLSALVMSWSSSVCT